MWESYIYIWKFYTWKDYLYIEIAPRRFFLKCQKSQLVCDIYIMFMMTIAELKKSYL